LHYAKQILTAASSLVKKNLYCCSLLDWDYSDRSIVDVPVYGAIGSFLRNLQCASDAEPTAPKHPSYTDYTPIPHCGITFKQFHTLASGFFTQKDISLTIPIYPPKGDSIPE
jgi:hypothetical protein